MSSTLVSKVKKRQKTNPNNGKLSGVPSSTEMALELEMRTTFPKSSTLVSKVKKRQQTNPNNGKLSGVPSSTEMALELEMRTTFPKMIIQDVYKVKNTFLKGMYLLKKEEYKVMYGDVSEHLLYHVTSAANVQSIIKNNFDWRRVKRGRFGLGTSFSDDVEYANTVANVESGCDRAVIICNVLVSNTWPVGERAWGLVIPPLNRDTVEGNNKVFVKFNDNEFLPRFVVYFKYLGENLQGLDDVIKRLVNLET